LSDRTLTGKDGKVHDLWELASKAHRELHTNTNLSELVAFVAYARTFPEGFTALVDTYDSLNSGVPNFLSVAVALHQVGYKAVGIRLDSGDLAYLSREARKIFKSASQKFEIPYFSDFTIVASNDLNEETILALNRQGHEIDVFAVGTNLVTCQAQPALGCVYKLVEIEGEARIKLSEDLNKITLPGRKDAYRLFSSTGQPILDILIPTTTEESKRPKVGTRILCVHPFEEQKRAFVVPSSVENIHQVVWENGKLVGESPSIHAIKRHVLSQIRTIREDHLRFLNPTPYKVSVNEELYRILHTIWLDSAPIKDLS